MKRSRTPPRLRLSLTALVLAPGFLLVALALGGPILSGDLWWHLSTGAWILEHGQLPRTDPFSHTAGDTAWILQEYASQVLFALVHGAADVPGLRVLGALLGLAVLYSVYRTARAQLAPAWAGLATALFALLYALKWELRPHLLSTLLFLRFASLLFPRTWGAPRAPGPRAWLEILVLSCLWVQLHAEALFAPILTAAGVCAALLGALREGRGLRPIGGWLVAFAAALGGTLLSPLGWEPHEYALVGRAAPQQYIEEWFRPWVLPGDPRFAPLTIPVWSAYLACVAGGGAWVLAQAWRRLASGGAVRALSWERIAFLAVCRLLALQARRFLWLAWFPAADGLAALVGWRTQLTARRIAPWAATAVLWLPLASTHYCALARSALFAGRFGHDVDRGLFPAVAADFVNEAGLEGNLFHRYEWGGYLGHRLGPRNPVFVDGRTVLFEEVIPERWHAERDPATARRVLDERDVRVIVFPALVDHGAGSTAWRPPGADHPWVRVWSDALANVWVRASDAENLARARDALAAHGIELDPDRGFTQAAALLARPEWLEERDLLPASVLASIRPFYRPELAPGPEGHLERAGAYLKHHMRRNAAVELEAWIAARFADDPEARALWTGKLQSEGPLAVHQRALARGAEPGED